MVDSEVSVKELEYNYWRSYRQPVCSQCEHNQFSQLRVKSLLCIKPISATWFILFANVDVFTDIWWLASAYCGPWMWPLNTTEDAKTKNELDFLILKLESLKVEICGLILGLTRVNAVSTIQPQLVVKIRLLCGLI